MRNFLKQLNIVGAVNTWEEGDILKHCLDNLLKWCDKIVVIMDRPDEATEELVRSYKKRYTGHFRIGYTDIDVLRNKDNTRRIEKVRRSDMVETKLALVRELHKEKPIDILLSPDSDEIFTDALPKILEEFMTRPETSICMKSSNVYNNMFAIHTNGMMRHWRIYKYVPTIHFTPRRFQDHYHIDGATWRPTEIGFVHLAQLEGFQELRQRTTHEKKFVEAHPDAGIWKVAKPANELTPEEYQETINREPDFNMKEYDELIKWSGGVKGKYTPQGKNNANKALRETSDLLDEMGIRHYLAFGTALGIVRDGKIIEHDWDNDFIIDADDLDKFDTKLAKKYGFNPIRFKQDIPKWKTEREESEELMIRTIAIYKYDVRNDLDPIYVSKDKKSGLILKGRNRNKFCAKHPIEWFKDAKEVEYMGKKYLVPYPYDEYFKSNYGDDWQTPIREHRKWHRRACLCEVYEIK